MKILVTGATGFVGHYVVEELLKEGHDVIATSLNINKAQNEQWFSRVNYIPFDLASFNHSQNYFEFFDRPEAMIHLAWQGLPDYKASFHLDKNLPAHFKLLENLIQNGLKDLTVTGTCLEYGMQEGCLTEGMEPRPENAYAQAKNRLRILIQELQGQYSFHFKWVRLFYMYGIGQNPKSLLSQLDRAISAGETEFKMSGGEQERDYLPVEKVAEYIVKITTQNEEEGIINVCSGRPIKVKEFVENHLRSRKAAIKLNLGFYPYTDYEPMRFWGDNKRLKNILNNE